LAKRHPFKETVLTLEDFAAKSGLWGGRRRRRGQKGKRDEVMEGNFPGEALRQKNNKLETGIKRSKHSRPG